MNFREFVQIAEEYLQNNGWTRLSHNGVWPVFMKGTRCALPEALVQDLWKTVVFAPTVEQYLLDSGWRRSSYVAAVGQQIFVRGASIKTIRMALLEQLKVHRLDRAEQAPAPTPEAMREILDVTQYRQTPAAR